MKRKSRAVQKDSTDPTGRGHFSCQFCVIASALLIRGLQCSTEHRHNSPGSIPPGNPAAAPGLSFISMADVRDHRRERDVQGWHRSALSPRAASPSRQHLGESIMRAAAFKAGDARHRMVLLASLPARGYF